MKSRSEITFYLNGQRQDLSGPDLLMPVADFLRTRRLLTGTKIVCAEGDCGACTALIAHPEKSSTKTAASRDGRHFQSLNTCIYPVLALDGCHLVTVEGLTGGLTGGLAGELTNGPAEKQKPATLHPVQDAMAKCHGSQCGFCTPGFVCAMTAMIEEAQRKGKTGPLAEKKIKNALTGNLCRCTGYLPIIEAAKTLEPAKITSLRARYFSKEERGTLSKLTKQPVRIETQNLLGEKLLILLPTTMNDAVKLRARYKDLKIVAGATDLGVQVNKGRTKLQAVMSLQNIPSLWQIKRSKSTTLVGARVSLTALQQDLEKHDPELNRILNIFASPQIKNTGTLVGNVVNGSPIGDTIPYLMAMDAKVLARGPGGKRAIAMSEFYLGYKKLALKPGELVEGIEIPHLKNSERIKLYKVSLRKDLDISAVTLAIRLGGRKTIETARIVFGGVGPTVVRLKDVEKSWLGQSLTQEQVETLLQDLSKQIAMKVNPISDVRGSRDYRLRLCRSLLLKAGAELKSELRAEAP